MNRLGFAVIVALAAARASAQDSVGSPAVEAPAALETVTVYARRIQPVTHVAATVTVIPQQQIERTLAGDVKQLVRYEPGLSVRSDPFRFGLDTFTARGMTGNRVAVEIDGIPAAGGFTIGSFSDSGRSFVDLGFVRNVQVLRGPASSLYGSDAIGGVVAMTTLTASDLLREGSEGSVRTEAGYSSDDDGWHAVAIGAARVGQADVVLGYVHRQGNELDTAASVPPDPRDYHADSVLAKLELDSVPGGPLTLTAEGGKLAQKTDVNAFEGLAGSRFVNTVTLSGDDSGSRFRASAAQQLDATAAFDSADWRLYWQGTDTDQDTFEQRNAVPPRTPPVQLDRKFKLQDRTLGVEFTAVKDIERDGTAHDFVYGIELEGTRLEELRNGLQTNLVTGATTKTILGETFPLRDFPVSDVTEAGAFVQDEIRFAGGAWTLIPALRADYYKLSPNADALYREDNPRLPVVGLEDWSVSPKLGVIRSFGGSAAAYFQYSHGFRSPPPEDVNIGLDLPLLNLRAIPNPDLKPETSNGYELGWRWNDTALSLTASGFWSDYDDFIESKVNLGKDPATGVTIFQSQNVAQARIYGAELSAVARLGVWAASLEGWTTQLAMAYAKGEDLERDEPLNSVDPASGVLSLRYDAPSGRWGGELATTAVAAKREVDRSRVDLYRTDSWYTLDLLGHVELGRSMWLGLAVFNITDQAYIEWADVRGRPVGDPLIPYYTHPGRNVSVTLHWQM
jgi:hemoglobin/transferrin/lactoferrin receptor protein